MQELSGPRLVHRGPSRPDRYRLARVVCVVSLLLGLTPVPCRAQRPVLRPGFSTTGVIQPPSALNAELLTSGSRTSGGVSDLFDALEGHGSVRSFREMLGPLVRVSHRLASYEFDLPAPHSTRLKLTASMGLGATTFRWNPAPVLIATPLADSETQVAVNVGLTLGYRFAPRLDLILRCQGYLDLGEVSDQALAARTRLSGDLDEAAWWRSPVQVGLRLQMP